MSGNAHIIGWTGGTGEYTELSPSLGYEPMRGDFVNRTTGKRYTLDSAYVIERLTRRLIVADVNKESVLQQLRWQGDITSIRLATSGGTEAANLGGEWDLLTIDDSRYVTGFSLLAVTYRRLAATAFRFNLPDGLTITCAAGVATIAYKGNAIEVIDSGTGRCGAGLTFEEIGRASCRERV